MRAALGLVILGPALLVGCADRPTSALEAFVAEYAIPDGLVVTVSFGDVASYMATDGSLQEGYVLQVQYSAPGSRLGFDRTFFDSDLRPTRQDRCNGWSGGRCDHISYRWVVADEVDWAATFGVLLDRHDAAGARQLGYEYDGRLAPTVVPDERGEARRQSYASRGALPALAAASVAPLARHIVAGTALPGSDADLPGVDYGLDDAIGFLRADDPEADAFLRDGCLAGFALETSGPGGAPDLATGPAVDSTLTMTFTNGTHRRSYEVEHGRRSALEPPGFVGSLPAFSWLGSNFPCQLRPPTASVPDLLTFVDRLTDHGSVSVAWDFQDDAPPILSLQASTGPGRVVADGVRGGLAAWYDPHRPLDEPSP